MDLFVPSSPSVENGVRGEPIPKAAPRIVKFASSTAPRPKPRSGDNTN